MNSVCPGCGLPELHKSCPAWGTDIYMNYGHKDWGNKAMILNEPEILPPELEVHQRFPTKEKLTKPRRSYLDFFAIEEKNNAIRDLIIALQHMNDTAGSYFDSVALEHNRDVIIEAARALEL